jgi:hypothetical protein
MTLVRRPLELRSFQPSALLLAAREEGGLCCCPPFPLPPLPSLSSPAVCCLLLFLEGAMVCSVGVGEECRIVCLLAREARGERGVREGQSQQGRARIGRELFV